MLGRIRRIWDEWQGLFVYGSLIVVSLVGLTFITMSIVFLWRDPGISVGTLFLCGIFWTIALGTIRKAYWGSVLLSATFGFLAVGFVFFVEKNFTNLWLDAVSVVVIAILMGSVVPKRITGMLISGIIALSATIGTLMFLEERTWNQVLLASTGVMLAGALVYITSFLRHFPFERRGE